MNKDKAILTCALTGVLTNPKQHPVPVTPTEMAAAARDAVNVGAAAVHAGAMREQRRAHAARAFSESNA